MLSKPALAARYAWLSVAAAVITIALKAAAYFLTGSIGFLSDALESFINLGGALLAVAMLNIAARPADSNHPYGHGKAEYFSSGIEGTFILGAALGIIFSAVQRLRHPEPLQQLGIGLAISVLAALVNFGVALLLLRAAKRHHSVTLEANAHHLLTDVWTSVGVLCGVGLVALTGWPHFDPLAALAVAFNIIWAALRIIRQAIAGLMDSTISPESQVKLLAVLERYRQQGVEHHALRTRQSGARQFVSMHVLVPGHWTVLQGHQTLERLEADVRYALPNVVVFTHLEPLNDPSSWDDTHLDRTDSVLDV